MCNQPATSVEHAPPKCIFPETKDVQDGKDYRKNLITVPSCDAHNLQKSEDDEYLFCVLSMSILNNKTGNNQFATKVMRALQKKPGLRKKVLKETRSVTVEDALKEKTFRTGAFRIDELRLNDIYDKMARAIFYHHYGKKFLDLIDIFPEHYLAISDDLALSRTINAERESLRLALDSCFEKAAVHGDNSEVFSYQFVEPPELTSIIARFHFYGSTRITVVFK